MDDPHPLEQTLAERVRGLEATQTLQPMLLRAKTSPVNVRDLRDTDVSQITDGQAMVYRKSTGRWHPISLMPPFNHPGALGLFISDPWPVLCNTRLRRLYIRLKTAGSSPTTVRLLKNGAPVAGASVTVAASAPTGGVSFDVSFIGPEADYAQLEITAAGTGAAGLIGQVY